ncbi:hypothetical protein [Aquimarina sp. AU474]|uniref:hypothetical protein n=1 Tax=Aquimarina sp. AU474 TaxID=2108529 RepID=UPI000D69C650|nr:hypothetical protein [Aquimarina sp. AU474]
MKIYVFFLLALAVHSCKVSSSSHVPLIIANTSTTINIQNLCPENGNCNVKTYKNSLITLKEDTTGRYYPVIEEGDYTVVEYTFKIKGPEGTVDGDYSETVHFQIAKTQEEMRIENDELNNVKLLFGKHCFCKGEAGYYRVNNGVLIVNKTEEGMVIDLEFAVNEVSHKIIALKETIIF